MEILDKIFFLPGDTVKVSKLENSPEMLVVGKSTSSVNVRGFKNTLFQGIKCKWFTTTGEIQSDVFNTKDLQKVYKNESRNI